MHTVEGMHNLHQVCSVGLDKISLQIWNLSCFCKFYTNGGGGPCGHLDFVSRFSLTQLVPCRLEDVRIKIEEDNYLISNDREMLAATLNVSEHSTVIAMEHNIESDDY
jgi:hypothetical protein